MIDKPSKPDGAAGPIQNGIAAGPASAAGAAADAKPGPAQAAPGVQVRVLTQYIKDLSFENPMSARMLEGPGDSPNLQLEVNVNANQVAKDTFESSISFKAHASSKVGVIYDMELVYAGLFRIEGLPQEQLEPFLLINCPSVLFPFARRLIADLTREGGYPPLMLDPIDFGSLYLRRLQEAASAAGAAGGPPRMSGPAGPSSPVPPKKS